MARRSSGSSSGSRSRVRRRHAAARRVDKAGSDKRGLRFTAEQHAEAVRLIAAGRLSREEIATHVGTTTESLRRWYAAARAMGTLPKADAPSAEAMAPAREAVPAPVAASLTSAPKDPGSGLGEHEVATILDYKKKHPSMEPA